jgi:hypothetical protein
MLKHSSLAARSLLLNYWSYNLPTTAIYEALKHIDFLVALSATKTLVFKIAIIVSTGDLTLSNLLVEQNNI